MKCAHTCDCKNECEEKMEMLFARLFLLLLQVFFFLILQCLWVDGLLMRDYILRPMTMSILLPILF